MAWSSTTGDLLLSVMEGASENELYHVESVTTGETTWTHDGSIRQVEVLLMALGFKQEVFLDNVAGTDQEAPVLQTKDRTYFNPP